MGNNKKIFKSIVKISVGITFISLTVILIYILLKGIPNLKVTLFSTVYNIDNVSSFNKHINNNYYKFSYINSTRSIYCYIFSGIC